MTSTGGHGSGLFGLRINNLPHSAFISFAGEEERELSFCMEGGLHRALKAWKGSREFRDFIPHPNSYLKLLPTTSAGSTQVLRSLATSTLSRNTHVSTTNTFRKLYTLLLKAVWPA